MSRSDENIKELRRRRIRRKATWKKKKVLQKLRVHSGKSLKGNDDLQQVKAKWQDEMRTSKVKLARAEVKERSFRNYGVLDRDEGKNSTEC